MIGVIRTRFQCQSCGALWQSKTVAEICCPPDEVFLCGKRRRGPYGTTNACVHWDKADARRHQKTDERRNPRRKGQ